MNKNNVYTHVYIYNIDTIQYIEWIIRDRTKNYEQLKNKTKNRELIII